MLEPAEQRLFRRLSVFRGSFSLAAAESVCAGYQLDVAEVLDLLAVLIDRSLVQVVDHPEEPRYRLLGTVRQYAAAKLWDGPEGPDRPRPARRVLPRPRRGRPGRPSTARSSRSWLERLELEHDNLEAALQWLLGGIDRRRSPAGPPAVAVLVPAGLLPRGPHPVRAPAHPSRGDLARAARPRPGQRRRGRVPAVRLRHRRRAPAAPRSSWSTNSVTSAPRRPRSSGSARSPASRPATTRLETCTSAAWPCGSSSATRTGVAASHDYLGFVAWLSGDSADGRGALRGGAVGVPALRQPPRRAPPRSINLGACALYRGRVWRWRGQRLEQALSSARALGFQEGIAWALNELAIVDPPRAPAGRRVRADAARGAAHPPAAGRPLAAGQRARGDRRRRPRAPRPDAGRRGAGRGRGAARAAGRPDPAGRGARSRRSPSSSSRAS